MGNRCQGREMAAVGCVVVNFLAYIFPTVRTLITTAKATAGKPRPDATPEAGGSILSSANLAPTFHIP